MKSQNKVVVPDHIAKEIEESQQTEKPEETEADKAYVEESKRVLDPTLLESSLLDRMPQPSGYGILVLPYKGKGVSEGGILLTQQHVERESLASVCAYVVKMGTLYIRMNLNLVAHLGVKKNNGYLLVDMLDVVSS